jgi:transposase
MLQNDLLPSINWNQHQRNCSAFILDNDGRHKNRGVLDFLEENGLDTIGFLPPNSPDLNPVENVWSQMKKTVQDIGPRNERELRQAIEIAYEGIDRQFLRKLFDSLPHRPQETIHLNGNYTEY